MSTREEDRLGCCVSRLTLEEYLTYMKYQTLYFIDEIIRKKNLVLSRSCNLQSNRKDFALNEH